MVDKEALLGYLNGRLLYLAHIPHHPICMGQDKIVCRLIVCGVHKRYVHTYAYCNSVCTYTCTYVYSYTYCVRTCFSHSMNVVYFPSQESFDFTSHHLIGSQCHPSNHKVHIHAHIPIVN